MKISKVTTAQPVVDTNGQPKSWNHQEYGLFYVHFIQFENGDKGEYNSKEQNQTKFTVGQDADYEYTPNQNPQYPGKIKPAQKDFKKGGQSNPRSMSAAYAKDIVVAYINKGDKIEMHWFTEWANLIDNWINNQPKKVQEDKIPTTTAGPEDQPDDLPF